MTNERDLELANALRDRMAGLLMELVGVVQRAGGYMTTQDQLILGEARSALVEYGKALRGEL